MPDVCVEFETEKISVSKKMVEELFGIQPFVYQKLLLCFQNRFGRMQKRISPRGEYNKTFKKLSTVLIWSYMQKFQR